MTLTRKNIAYSLPLLLLGVLFFVQYLLYPPVLDDESFLGPLKTYFSNPTLDNLLSGWSQSMSHRFQNDNGRIFNLIATAFLVMPRWLFSLLITFCAMSILYLCSRIARVWQAHFAVYSLMTFLFVLALPWADQMFTVMFSLNYIPASALALYILQRFLTGRPTAPWLALILGVAVSICHEGIGGPLLLGILVVCVFFPQYRRLSNFLLMAGICAGIFYLLFLVPGTRNRVSGNDFLHGFLIFFRYLHNIILFIVFAGLTIIARFNNKWWTSINKPTLTALFATCAGGIGLWMLWMTGARLAWWVDVASLAGIGFVLAPVATHLSKRPFAIAGAALIAVAALQLAACLPYTARMKKDYTTIRELSAQQGRTNVFYDAFEPWDTPWYVLGKTNFNGLRAWNWSTYRAVPTILSDFTPDSAQKIDSNIGNAYIVDGTDIVVDFTDLPVQPEGNIWLNLMIDGKMYSIDTLPIEFTASDGQRWLYLRPAILSFRIKWRNISGVYQP